MKKIFIALFILLAISLFYSYVTMYDPEFDYLNILMTSPQYGDKIDLNIPDFTYQSKENDNFELIRIKYNLVEVAGTGSEIDKILNLLHWVHNRLTTDGSALPVHDKNALKILETAKDGETFNCGESQDE